MSTQQPDRISGVMNLMNLLTGQSPKQVTSGGTTKQQTNVSDRGIQELLRGILESTSGLSGVTSGQRGAGLYNSSTNSLLANDLLARATNQAELARSPTVTSRSPQIVQMKQPSQLGNLATGVALNYLNKKLGVTKALEEGADKVFDSVFGSGANTAASPAASVLSDSAPALSAASSAGFSAPSLDVGFDLGSGLGNFNSPGIDSTPVFGTPVSDFLSGGSGAEVLAGSAALDTLGTSFDGLATYSGNALDMAQLTGNEFSTLAPSDWLGNSGSMVSGSTSTIPYIGAAMSLANGNTRGAIGSVAGSFFGPIGSFIGGQVAAPVMQASEDFWNGLDSSGTATNVMDPLAGITSKGADVGDWLKDQVDPLGAGGNDDGLIESISKGGCFLTTAVCEFQNKPDDCHELEVLRKFRDTWLQENYPQDIKLYYRTAPHIVEKLKSHLNHAAIFWQMYTDYILPAVHLIEIEKYEDAYVKYRELYNWVSEIE